MNMTEACHPEAPRALRAEEPALSEVEETGAIRVELRRSFALLRMTSSFCRATISAKYRVRERLPVFT